MIDFHSHFLPEIDDGAKSVEMAAQMLALSKSQGVNTIVATPHFYIKKGSVDDFLEKRKKSYEKLMAYVNENNIDIPEIKLGAEVAFSEEILNEDIKKLCIEGTSTVLIELPFSFWNDWIYNALFEISVKNKVDIVIAHLERYITNHKDFSPINPLFELDVYIQVNADSIIDKSYKKIIKKLFDKYRVDLIGTDMHNLEKRTTHYDKAIKHIQKKYSERKFNKIISNGKMLLNI